MDDKKFVNKKFNNTEPKGRDKKKCFWLTFMDKRAVLSIGSRVVAAGHPINQLNERQHGRGVGIINILLL